MEYLVTFDSFCGSFVSFAKRMRGAWREEDFLVPDCFCYTITWISSICNFCLKWEFWDLWVRCDPLKKGKANILCAHLWYKIICWIFEIHTKIQTFVFFKLSIVQNHTNRNSQLFQVVFRIRSEIQAKIFLHLDYDQLNSTDVDVLELVFVSCTLFKDSDPMWMRPSS